MTGPRVQVTLRPVGRDVFGTRVGPEFSQGPTLILIDGMRPARLVERPDWEYLPGEDPEGDRG